MSDMKTAEEMFDEFLNKNGGSSLGSPINAAYEGFLAGYKEAMRYLITTNIQPPFLSDWFDAENHFNTEVGMVVYDLAKSAYTTDGEKWEQIEEDHL